MRAPEITERYILQHVYLVVLQFLPEAFIIFFTKCDFIYVEQKYETLLLIEIKSDLIIFRIKCFITKPCKMYFKIMCLIHCARLTFGITIKMCAQNNTREHHQDIQNWPKFSVTEGGEFLQ
jgi:hypothetical protein